MIEGRPKPAHIWAVQSPSEDRTNK